MIWQDWLLFLGGLALFAGLAPMLWAQVKPPLSSSATLASVLWSYAFAFASLDLWLTLIGVSLQATVWTALFAQKLWQTLKARGNRGTRWEYRSGDLLFTDHAGVYRILSHDPYRSTLTIERVEPEGA